jgi:hypothetical protein
MEKENEVIIDQVEQTEIAQVEQKHEVSTNVFSNAESFKDIFNIGKMFASSTLVPIAYQNKPMDCTIAVDMANRMGVSPMMVMQNLYVVKGKPSWSGQACMSMINASPKFKSAKPVYFGEKGTENRGCRIEAIETETGSLIQGTDITIKMAKEEGWLSNTKWKNMPEQMLAYRAAAFFARIYIPNALMGVSVEGEVEDIETNNTSEITNLLKGRKEDI